jgi:dolichyl-phosphate-mannose--protein O-mannosyl transferase
MVSGYICNILTNFTMFATMFCGSKIKFASYNARIWLHALSKNVDSKVTGLHVSGT